MKLIDILNAIAFIGVIIGTFYLVMKGQSQEAIVYAILLVGIVIYLKDK